MLVTDICLSVFFRKMLLQIIFTNRRNTLFTYISHKSSLFSIFFKKLLTISIFSCIVNYVVEMQYNFIIKDVQEWRNWQTRRLQVPVVAISCGFKSRFLHYFFIFVQAGFCSIFIFCNRKRIAAFTFSVNTATFSFISYYNCSVPSQFPFIFQAQMLHTGESSSVL